MDKTKIVLINAIAFVAGVIVTLLLTHSYTSMSATYPHGVACYNGGTRMSDGSVIYDCRIYGQAPK